MRLLGVGVRRTVDLSKHDFDLRAELGKFESEGSLEIQSPPNVSGGRDVLLVVKCSEAAEKKIEESLGDWVIVEEAILHAPQAYLMAGQKRKIIVEGELGGAVRALLFVRGHMTEQDGIEPSSLGEVVTDKDGRTEVECDVNAAVHVRITDTMVSPFDQFWPVHVGGLPEKIFCPEIHFDDLGYGWWHSLLGFANIAPTAGQSIRIGVVDSCCGEHIALEHVNRVSMSLDFPTSPGADSELPSIPHGTIVAGALSARPVNGHGYWGVAPGAELFAADAVGSDIQALSWNIAKAIRLLVDDHDVDLINISLGSNSRSALVEEAIYYAAAKGCVCFCAAGNTASDVLWPARIDVSIAITAVGIASHIPEKSYHAEFLPKGTRHDDPMPVLAEFSCHGAGVDCCGPGLGIISTYPAEISGHSDAWVAVMGTSVAAPLVCGSVAAHLENSERFHALPRDESRVAFVRDLLFGRCRGLGLTAEEQGHGLFSLAKATRSP